MDEWRQREEETARQLEQLQAAREEDAAAAAAELARVRADAESTARDLQASYIAKMTALADRVAALEVLKFPPTAPISSSISPAAAPFVRSLQAPTGAVSTAGIASVRSHSTSMGTTGRLPSLSAVGPGFSAPPGAGLPSPSAAAAMPAASTPKPVYAWQQGGTPLLRPLRR